MLEDTCTTSCVRTNAGVWQVNASIQYHRYRYSSSCDVRPRNNTCISSDTFCVYHRISMISQRGFALSFSTKLRGFMLVNPDLRYCHEICAKFWVAPTLLAAFVLPNLPRQIEPTHRQARGRGAGVPGGCGGCWGQHRGGACGQRQQGLILGFGSYSYVNLLCDRVPNAVGLASRRGLRFLSGLCVHSARNKVLFIHQPTNRIL